LRGLLYDVHGNAKALDAVLADAGGAGVERFVLGGDYALFGPQPKETVERLHELDATWIRGNGERWTANPGDAPDDLVVQGAIAWCAERLGDRMVEELANLPAQKLLDGVLYCHASPVSDVRSFFPEPAPDEDELLAGVEDETLVFGHTHLPFRRQSEHGVLLVNPGSVGMPFDGDPRAAWAILHDDGAVEQRRVVYDHEAAARAVREIGAPWCETVALRIEQARFDVQTSG
jgi:diadenosine tetraphosphatase ApaH/serine/threonine PP2A family protein phosphatase